MTTAFAAYSDVCTRMADDTLAQAQVEALLEDASAMLLALLGPHYDAADELQAANLKTVCCNVVSRALAATTTGAGFGVQQHSMTASAFNEQFTYSNPAGDLYLTATEKRMLGIGAGRIGATWPYAGRGAS